MTSLHHEIHIDAAPEAVWAVLADLPTVAAYNDGVVAARWVSQQREGVGAARVCQLAPKGEVTEEVAVWEPNQALGLRIRSSPWPPIKSMEWTTRLRTGAANTTHVIQDLTYTVGAGPVGALLNTLVIRRKLSASLGGVFANLKTYVEHIERGGCPGLR